MASFKAYSDALGVKVRDGTMFVSLEEEASRLTFPVRSTSLHSLIYLCFICRPQSTTWSPTSQFLAIGSYDECVRVVNNVTWKKICELTHENIVRPPTVVYREVMEPLWPICAVSNRF